MTQNALILSYLKRGRSLTPLVALDKFQTLRLGARIYDLRRAGHDIKSAKVKVGRVKYVSSYSL